MGLSRTTSRRANGVRRTAWGDEGGTPSVEQMRHAITARWVFLNSKTISLYQRQALVSWGIRTGFVFEGDLRIVYRRQAMCLLPMKTQGVSGQSKTIDLNWNPGGGIGSPLRWTKATSAPASQSPTKSMRVFVFGAGSGEMYSPFSVPFCPVHKACSRRS